MFRNTQNESETPNKVEIHSTSAFLLTTVNNELTWFDRYSWNTYNV